MKSKTKNIILIIGFFLALVLCYQLALSKTLALKTEFKTLKKQDLLFESTPKQLSLLKQKQKYYDSILVKHQINGSSLQNNLLKAINTFADSSNIKVVSFSEPHVINQNALKINTYQFSLEGNYNAMIKLIYKLEQETRFGEIISLHFEKKKNFRTNTYYLQAHVMLRNFGN
ncbi:hypothetical protein [Seonamhaeicola sp.]|uniref:hypothetical protein n=1 Tax=Seonamhaeicola sp. TaxID=1912245 RepID=UPI002626FE0F|nr:hypothetical protein [Seonamhaeicola sp.]